MTLTQFVVAVWGVAALAGCGEKKPQAHDPAWCFDTARQCVRACDNAEKNASAEFATCRNTCNDTHKAASVVCAHIADQRSRFACVEKANQDFEGCAAGCEDRYSKARQEAPDCRNTCINELQQCTSGK